MVATVKPARPISHPIVFVERTIDEAPREKSRFSRLQGSEQFELVRAHVEPALPAPQADS